MPCQTKASLQYDNDNDDNNKQQHQQLIRNYKVCVGDDIGVTCFLVQAITNINSVGSSSRQKQQHDNRAVTSSTSSNDTWHYDVQGWQWYQNNDVIQHHTYNIQYDDSNTTT